MSRDEIIKELGKFCIGSNDSGEIYNIDAIADFIIRDRKSVVEPLVKYKMLSKIKHSTNFWNHDSLEFLAIDQTLENAGVEDV